MGDERPEQILRWLSDVSGNPNHADETRKSRDPDEKGRRTGTELAAARNVFSKSLALRLLCDQPGANDEQDRKRVRNQRAQRDT